MNEEMKKELIAAILMSAVATKAGKEDTDKTHLGPDKINELIERANLGIDKVTPENCPIRALFNLIEGLSAKVEALEEELNFVKSGWNPNDPVKIVN